MKRRLIERGLTRKTQLIADLKVIVLKLSSENQHKGFNHTPKTVGNVHGAVEESLNRTRINTENADMHRLEKSPAISCTLMSLHVTSHMSLVTSYIVMLYTLLVTILSSYHMTGGYKNLKLL